MLKNRRIGLLIFLSVMLGLNALAIIPYTSAATSFYDGFETNDFSLWTSDLELNGDNTITSTPANVNNGTYAYSSSVTILGNNYAFLRKEFASAETTIWAVADIYHDSLITDSGDMAREVILYVGTSTDTLRRGA